MDRALAHVPTPVAALLFRLLASPREIAPLPGWDFGLKYGGDEVVASPADRLRRSVWEYFNKRGARVSVAMPWISNLTLLAYPGNDTTWPLFVGGCIDPNEIALLTSVLSPGMVFVDVGANEGLFSLVAARAVGKTGIVIALEPSRRECDRLRANVDRNQLSNVRPLLLALSNEEGFAELRVAEAWHGGQNTLGGFVYEEIETQGTERVPVTTLDHLVKTMSLDQVDVVKIDVEGSEMAVVEGAAETIRRFHPLLIFEVLDPALRLQGASKEGLITHLNAQGYRLFSFDEGTGLPTPLVDLPGVSCNLVATHRDRPWKQVDGR